MKQFIFYLFITSLLVFTSCSKDENPVAIDYSYHAHVHSPDSTDKNLNDTLHIHVEFESHTGETVHHINIQISNKANATVVYNKPDDPHVDEASGLYDFEDDLVLSAANGFTAGTDWILKATVWGDQDGDGEVSETVEFHVN
jgi:hypothetical protein